MKKPVFFVMAVAVIWLFNANGCFLPDNYPIRIHNNTKHDISVFLSYGNPLFPDTLLPDRYYDTWGLHPTKPGIPIGYSTGIPYKRYIQSYGSDTIIIFIFHTDTLLKYTWDEVREGYMILKRYDVSWQEMERLHGHIKYPPTEAEKGISQFPPYEQ